MSWEGNTHGVKKDWVERPRLLMSGPGLRSVTSVTRKVASGEVKRLPAPRAPRPEVTVVSASVLLVAAPLVSFSIIFNLKETTLKFHLFVDKL